MLYDTVKYMTQELISKNEADNIERRRVRDAVFDLYAQTGKYPSTHEVSERIGMRFTMTARYMSELDIVDVRKYYQRKAGGVLEMLLQKAIKEKHTYSAKVFLDFISKDSDVNVVQITETFADLLNKKTIDATIIDKNDTDTDK